MNPWRGRVDVEIVVPVRNEERVLQESVWRLHRYLSLHLPMEWRITLVDNASGSRSTSRRRRSAG
jgi:hypothetical protein